MEDEAEDAQAPCLLCANYEISSHRRQLPFGTKLFLQVRVQSGGVDGRLLFAAGVLTRPWRDKVMESTGV